MYLLRDFFTIYHINKEFNLTALPLNPTVIFNIIYLAGPVRLKFKKNSPKKIHKNFNFYVKKLQKFSSIKKA